MDTQTHVLLALKDTEESSALTDRLALAYDITLDTVYSRYDIFECINDFNYNVIIIDDSLLGQGDIAHICRESLTDDPLTPNSELILLSHTLNQSSVLEDYDEPIFVFKAPASAEFLLQLIRRSRELQSYRLAHALDKRKSIDELISALFSSLGMQTDSPGARHLREAVHMCLEKPHMLDAVTKMLYPALAKKSGVSVTLINRRIRQEINRCFSHGDLDQIRTLFGHEQIRDGEHITTVEFISRIGSAIRAGAESKEPEGAYQ